MTSFMLTSELREELRQLYYYDGPAHPDWSATAVKASLRILNSFLILEDDSEEHEAFNLVNWAFEEGRFPELSKLLSVSPKGVRWREDVPDELRAKISEIVSAQVQVLHARPGKGSFRRRARK